MEICTSRLNPSSIISIQSPRLPRSRRRLPEKLTAINSRQRSSSIEEKSSNALEQLDLERGVCIPFRKYTPEAVRGKVLESQGAILSLIGRGVEIVWNLGFYWSSLAYDCLVGRDEEVVPYRARQLRNLLCDLGPSFIKAGQIHSKKKNRLAQQCLNDLVFVKYNRALRRRYDARDRIDPITLTDIDDSNEWLMSRMEEDIEAEQDDELVFDDDLLTWDEVARASGVEEESYRTRLTRGKTVIPTKVYEKGSTSKPKPTPVVRRNDSDVEEEEAEYNEDEEEYDDMEEEDDTIVFSEDE